MDFRKLFASGARARFNCAQSDVDFLPHLDDGLLGPIFDDHSGLKAALEAMLARPVDRVMPDAIANPYLQADIALDSTTLLRR